MTPSYAHYDASCDHVASGDFFKHLLLLFSELKQMLYSSGFWLLTSTELLSKDVLKLHGCRQVPDQSGALLHECHCRNPRPYVEPHPLEHTSLIINHAAALGAWRWAEQWVGGVPWSPRRVAWMRVVMLMIYELEERSRDGGHSWLNPFTWRLC